jgi:hypothetical protein
MGKKKKKAKKEKAAPKLADAESEGLAAGARSAEPVMPGGETDRRKRHVDGIKMTLVPAILGVGTGFVCNHVLGISTVLPWHFVMMVVILTTFVIQKIIYPPIGIDVFELKGKDWLYVEFIAVDLWLVTWTILLN